MADDDAVAMALREACKLPGHEGVCARISVLREHGLGLDPELFDVAAQCFVCKVATKEPVRCSACAAIIYCSSACRATDWSKGVASTSKHYAASVPHQTICARFQEHMRLAGSAREHADFFPWLALPVSGKFSRAMLLAAHGVLGEHKGYWSQPNTASVHAVNALNQPGATVPVFHYGAMLHRATHPTDRDGWRLSADHVPPLQELRAADVPPPPTAPLRSWRDYYMWRRLSPSSVAALLMEVPLTLYHLIASQPQLRARPSLTVHLVGCERELSYLPLLGELALLLPHRRLTIVAFGVEVQRAWREAPEGSVARGLGDDGRGADASAEAAAPVAAGGDVAGGGVAGGSVAGGGVAGGMQALCAPSDGIAAAAGQLAEGRRVLLHSLQSKPHLNGLSGTVLGWHSASGRWMVRLDHSSNASMKLKATNLRGPPSPQERPSGAPSVSLVYRYARPASSPPASSPPVLPPPETWEVADAAVDAAADAAAGVAGCEVLVYLEHGGGTWQEACLASSDARSYSHALGVPDLVWGANAGVSSYSEWSPVIEACAYLGVPLVTTEYCAASHDADEAYVLPLALASAAAAARVHGRRTASLETVQRWLNPFRGPGQRQISISDAPDFSNGFVMLIDADRGGETEGGASYSFIEEISTPRRDA